MFNLQEITECLIAKTNFTQLDSKAYVDWAVLVLGNGYDSENLRILAGLDFADTVERQEYFNKAVSDLRIQIPTDRNKILNRFVKKLANDVINRIETPNKALSLMEDVIITSDYSSKYLQFMDLAEEIELLTYSNSPLCSAELSSDKINEMIISEFKLYLQSESLQKDIRNLSYCKICKKSMKPNLKKHYSLFKFKRYYYYVCSQCGSKEVVHGTSQEGRELIIQT